MGSKLTAIGILFAFVFLGCVHEPVAILDDTLFDEISSSQFIHFRGGNELAPTSPSPHGSFSLKYNIIASSVLDQDGKVEAGKSFPNGSLIVKEVIKKGKTQLYAVMKKDSTNSFAGDQWLWAEYEPNGTVHYSVSRKGGACIACHLSAPNSDLTKVFDLH
jgi:hypothetical protein